jgi:hypothetical protein
VAAVLNKCDGRSVLLGRSPEWSRGAQCHTAETLRTVRPVMARPEIRGICGGTVFRSENQMCGDKQPGPYLRSAFTSRLSRGPLPLGTVIWGALFMRMGSGRVPVSRTELRVGCTLCASLVCDVCWWTTAGVPRDLSGSRKE